MTKSSGLLEAAFREVADLRDTCVQDRTVALDRLQGLHETVAAEFPLETALRETALRRDRALSSRTGKVSERVRKALVAQERGRPIPARWAPDAARLLVRLRSVLQIPKTIGLATAIFLAGLLFFEFRHPPANEVAKVGRGALFDSPISKIAKGPDPHWRGDHFLTGAASHLVLQVSATELAKLRSSSLIAKRGFSRNRFEANLELQLEPPMSQILSEAGRSELP